MKSVHQPLYLKPEQLINLIVEPNRTGCMQILRENEELFKQTQGSTHNHQTWEGGYYDHLQEIMNITRLLYRELSRARPLPFTLGDALLVVFLHDIEKPWKYEKGPNGKLQHKPLFNSKTADHEFRMSKLTEYKITLTTEQINALKYVEGELDDYNPHERVMGPLGALCHMADIASARIWFNYPAIQDDPWDGAQRVKK